MVWSIGIQSAAGVFSTRFFTACHPVLPEEGRIALTLRLIGGLTTTEIASGDEWTRAPLSEEALRLARMLVQLLPGESEVHALLALMELNGSRTAGRREAMVRRSCCRIRTVPCGQVLWGA